MKKNAFTLIELLAVIVIIGLLSVLIIPKVSRTIKESRNNINKASVSGLIRVAENYYMDQKVMLHSFQGCSYDFTNNTNTCEGIEFSGEKPESGKLKISSNGDVSLAVKFDNSCYIKLLNEDNIIEQSYDQSTCDYSLFKGTYVAPTNTDTHKGIVYLDPTNLRNQCNETLASQNVDSETGEVIGVKSGCMKFYIFDENSDGTVDMILDHNTSLGIDWIDVTDVSYGPRLALYQLYEDTKDWNGITSLTSSSNYNFEVGNQSYTIDYLKHFSRTGEEGSYTYTLINGAHKARLITAEEVALALGKEDFHLTDEFIAFGSLSDVDYLDQTQEQQERQQSYSWLFDNLCDCEDYGCSNSSAVISGNYSYWTSSFYMDVSNNSKNAFLVDYVGSLSVMPIRVNRSVNPDYVGIRPVITVPKSLLEID